MREKVNYHGVISNPDYGEIFSREKLPISIKDILEMTTIKLINKLESAETDLSS